ncbi:MAG: hypothetical protein HY908_08910 [Myxococcales bacterium]|nr:hypothetical protein [Myxococcales bacterium]
MSILVVELVTGRRLHASAFHVQATYAGLLEGYPDAERNELRLGRMPDRARQLLGALPVHVVAPPRRRVARPDPEDPPAEYLPACWIAASFRSDPIDRVMHGSSAILVWFQEAPFPMPSPEALADLRRVDWNALAQDYEY